MRRIWKAAALCAALLVGLCSCSETATTDGIEYTLLQDDTYQVGACSLSDAEEIIIPSRVRGRTVTSIDYNAFDSCTSLKKLILPDTITDLTPTAFDECVNLDFNTFDNALYLGTAKNKYKYLIRISETEAESCTIHPKCSYICSDAFSESAITSITIPDSVTIIADDAFYRCQKLESVVLSENLTGIFCGSFDYCDSLLYNTWNGGLYLGTKKNPYFAFYEPEDTDVTSFSINEDCRILFNKCFSECRFLKSVSLPKGITAIPDYAFYRCLVLESITLPDAVRSIGEYAFSQTALSSITFPKGLLSISFHAFSGCSSLEAVFIPAKVEYIGVAAFCSCPSLASIEVDPKNKYYDSRGNCNAIIRTKDDTLLTGCFKTVIPDSVKSLGIYSFYGQTALEEIVIPDGVTEIGCNSDELYSSYGKEQLYISYSGLYRYDNKAVFGACTSLRTITIPQGIRKIEYLISGCVELSCITYGGSVREWNLLDLGSNWVYGACSFAISCTDGTLEMEKESEPIIYADGEYIMNE